MKARSAPRETVIVTTKRELPRGPHLKRPPKLIDGLLSHGLRRMVADDSGQADPAKIADYLRASGDDDAIIHMVADWLDPAVKDKAYGWKLVFARGRGQRKSADRTVMQCLRIAEAYRRKLAAGDRRRHKQIVGDVAREFGIGDESVRHYLAAAKKAESFVNAAIGALVLEGRALKAANAEQKNSEGVRPTSCA